MSDGFSIKVTGTNKVCPVGESYGRQNLDEGRIPVLSCEGSCIRGEIARLAAGMIAKEEPFRRACHGELLSAPHSGIAGWVQGSEKVVLIDGCFMSCHGRIFENLLDRDRLVRFDALSVYRKYTDRIEIDSVPEEERKAAARQVADAVLAELRRDLRGTEVPQARGACS